MSRVHEVTLGGAADVSYWRDRLAVEGLCPVEVDGQARVTIGITHASYAGLRADECVIAVPARPVGNSGSHDGYFLVQSYNASRLLAWSERVWFGTPYLHGTPTIGAHPHFELPIDVVLTVGGSDLFSANLGGNSRERKPDWTGQESWEGPIYLPRAVARRSATVAEPPIRENPRAHARPSLSAGKLFYARLGGLTHKYPFDPTVDRLSIQSIPAAPAWSILLESGFHPLDWSIRPSATHARSKTYRRKASAEF